jgi:hypothetical protein
MKEWLMNAYRYPKRENGDFKGSLQMPGRTRASTQDDSDGQHGENWKPFERYAADYPALRPELVQPKLQYHSLDAADEREAARERFLDDDSNSNLSTFYHCIDFSRLDSLSTWESNVEAEHRESFPLLSVVRTVNDAYASHLGDFIGIQFNLQSGKIEQWLLGSQCTARLTYDVSQKAFVQRCLRRACSTAEERGEASFAG